MASVIRNRIPGVFIPVRDIQSAKEWYCNLLGLEPSGEILHGHLYILPMENAVNVILDSKIFSEEKVFQIPAFQFETE